MILKIWSGQFVDFIDLLNPEDVGIYDVSYSNQDESKGMVLTQRPKKEIKTYNDWMKAWKVYSVVYLKHPGNVHKHQQLTTYARNIREMREKKLNWLMYDHRFRWDRLRFGENIPPWGVLRQDLYNDLITSLHLNGPFVESQATEVKSQASGNTVAPSQPKKSNTGYIPPSFCYGFDNPKKQSEAGNGCSYKHSCPKCDGEHALYNCKVKGKHKNKKKPANSNSSK